MDEMRDPGERFLWFAFLLLAGDSPYEGKIALTEEMGYSDEQIGSLLKCDSILVKRAKKIMVKYDKIKVLDNNIIQIINWQKYQSEYQRQKPYRSEDGQKLLRKVTTKSDNEGLLIDRDREKDRDIDIDLDGDKEYEYILNFLSKVKGYPFNEEKDLVFIKELRADFPDVDILEKVKQICANWLDRPLVKKSRPRVQIRRWVSNEHKWQREAQVQKRVGQTRPEDKLPIPYKKWQEIAGVLIDRGYNGEKVMRFNYKATGLFPKIKLQWEQSDQKPETFIRLVDSAGG